MVHLQKACPGVACLPFDVFYIVFLDLIKTNFSVFFLAEFLSCAGPGEYIKGSLVLNIPGGGGGLVPVA